MSTQSLLIGFFVCLGLVVVSLGIAIWLAKQHKVRGHIIGICVMLVFLLATLWFAETLGTRYEFESTSYWVHLPIAVGTSVFMLLPLGAGVQVWRGKVSVETHKKLVGVWLVLVVASLGTGLWMLGAATPL